MTTNELEARVLHLSARLKTLQELTEETKQALVTAQAELDVQETDDWFDDLSDFDD